MRNKITIFLLRVQMFKSTTCFPRPTHSYKYLYSCQLRLNCAKVRFRENIRNQERQNFRTLKSLFYFRLFVLFLLNYILLMDIKSGNFTRQGQVHVHFTTNASDIKLPEGKRNLLVPTSKLCAGALQVIVH